MLPHRKMVDSFKCLLTAAESPDYHGKLSQLLTYVNNTWFNNVVWSSKDICSYQRLVRTNNDCEGYHRRLKERCGTYPPIYKLVENLYKEAILVDYTCRLISTQAATTTRRKKAVEKQAHLQALWDELATEDLSNEDFLLRASVYAAISS